MGIESNCSGCGQRLRVADEHRGKQARCPACGTIYIVGGNPVGAEIAPQLAPLAPSPASSQAEIAAPVASTGMPNLYAKTPDGNIYGPVDQPTLDRWLREGRLNDRCQVRDGETAPWTNIASFMGAAMGSPIATASPLAQTIGHGQAINPYADATAYAGQGSHPQSNSPYPQTIYIKKENSDRSGVILTMGILSWVLSCAYVGWIMSIIGIVLALQDFAAMKEGKMSTENRGLTQVGFWLCVMNLILSVLAIFMGVLFFVIAIANAN